MEERAQKRLVVDQLPPEQLPFGGQNRHPETRPSFAVRVL